MRRSGSLMTGLPSDKIYSMRPLAPRFVPILLFLESLLPVVKNQWIDPANVFDSAFPFVAKGILHRMRLFAAANHPIDLIELSILVRLDGPMHANDADDFVLVIVVPGGRFPFRILHERLPVLEP